MTQENIMARQAKRLRRLSLLPLFVSIALLTVLALPASAQLIDEELSASAGEKLRLDLDTGATVTITGWDKNAVAVKATGRNPERYRTSVERRGNTIFVKSDFAEHKNHHSSNIRMEISVPRTFDVEIQSSGGGVHISDVEGRFEGETMGGEIELHRLVGTAKLETMGGNILVTDSELDGKVSTMGGRVTMRDIVGTLDGSSMGGKVTLENVTPGGGSSSSDPVTISTMGGAIEVASAPAGAKLETMGGSIRVGSATDFVDAHTMGGSIHIDEVEGWVKAITMGGDITVNVIGEGRNGTDIELDSMGGDVQLTVPRGFSMEIDIEIAYTKRHLGKHEIKSDVALQRTGTDTWEREHGSHKPRRYLYGKATIGGGKHRVTIHTINGDVILKEE